MPCPPALNPPDTIISRHYTSQDPTHFLLLPPQLQPTMSLARSQWLTSLCCPQPCHDLCACATPSRQIPSSQMCPHPCSRSSLVLSHLPLIASCPQPSVAPSPSERRLCPIPQANLLGSTWLQNCLPVTQDARTHPRRTSVRSRCCTHCPHFPTAHSLLSTLLSGSHVCQSPAKSALAARSTAKSWMRLQPPLERLLSSAQTLRQKLRAIVFVWPQDFTFICFPSHPSGCSFSASSGTPAPQSDPGGSRAGGVSQEVASPVLLVRHSPATSTLNSCNPTALGSPQTSYAYVSGGCMATAMDLLRLTATLL